MPHALSRGRVGIRSSPRRRGPPPRARTRSSRGSSRSADVRVALESRGLALTDWSLSGHTWVFGRRRDPVAVVKEHTWPAFGPRMIERFRRLYGSYLAGFRG